MGEYWKPVNVTKREYIDPHDMNDGLKLGEWNLPESGTRRLMDERWEESDTVVFVSDYDGFELLRGEFTGEWPTYDTLDEAGFKRVLR